VKVCNLIQVALTYDDGPSSAYTPKVLDMLKQHDIKVTFFLVGNRISTTPSSVKRMAQEGHEIGYHTWGHTFFFNMTAKQIKDDFEKFQTAVYNASGSKATVYRAPGGNITDTALKTIPLPHIMWSVDTRDWETRNAESVKKAVINGLKDGAIILVHDIHATTYQGTKAAIEYIIKNDLDVEFLTVTELLSRKGTPPQAGKTYYKN
jgi:peptidoglycan/xylan/chitin deacetylase (PgdA/CDA1 family)